MKHMLGILASEVAQPVIPRSFIALGVAQAWGIYH